MSRVFDNFLNELKNKGVIYDKKGEFLESQTLDSIYPWGYILRYSSLYVEPIYHFFDNDGFLICSLNPRFDTWSILNNILKCTRDNNGITTFTYNLNKGIPITLEEVVAFLHIDDPSLCGDCIMFVEDSNALLKAYRGKIDEPIEDITNLLSDRNSLVKRDLDYFMKQGFEIMSQKYAKNTLDFFNNLIVTKGGF